MSLAFGADVLADVHRIDVLDVRHDYGEDRFVTYAMVDGRVWVCVFAPRGTVNRIIPDSAVGRFIRPQGLETNPEKSGRAFTLP